jgi:DNA-binding response OmpR family regulator
VLDGWAVLADLGTRELAPPVIVCSAKGSPRDLARAYELGAVEYITKPFDMEDVLDTVRDVLDRFAEPEPQYRIEPPMREVSIEGVEPA